MSHSDLTNVPQLEDNTTEEGWEYIKKCLREAHIKYKSECFENDIRNDYRREEYIPKVCSTEFLEMPIEERGVEFNLFLRHDPK